MSQLHKSTSKLELLRNIKSRAAPVTGSEVKVVYRI